MSGGGSGGGGEKRRGVVCSGNGGIEVAHACKRTVAHGPADSVVFEDAFDACEVGDRRFGHEKVAAPRRFTAQSWWCASTICAEAGDTLGCAFQTGDRNIFNEAVVHVDTARVVGVSQVWPASLGQVTTHQGLTAKDVRWLAHHLPPPPPPPPPPAPLATSAPLPVDYRSSSLVSNRQHCEPFFGKEKEGIPDIFQHLPHFPLYIS